MGGRAPPGQNKRSPCAESRWPAEARGSPAQEPSSSPPYPSTNRPACRHRSRLSSPNPAACASNSRSWRRSTGRQSSGRNDQLRDPTPSARHARAPQGKTCSSFCSSWLHPIWKLEPPANPGRFILIRTGIGALIVGAGELVYQFTRLVSGAGGFGEVMSLLKDVAVEIWERIRMGAAAAGAAATAMFFDLKADAASGMQSAIESVVGFGNTAANT